MVAGLTSVADSRAPAPRPGRHRPLARVVVTHPQAPALETAHHPPPRLASKRGARTPRGPAGAGSGFRRADDSALAQQRLGHLIRVGQQCLVAAGDQNRPYADPGRQLLAWRGQRVVVLGQYVGDRHAERFDTG